MSFVYYNPHASATISTYFIFESLPSPFMSSSCDFTTRKTGLGHDKLSYSLDTLTCSFQVGMTFKLRLQFRFGIQCRKVEQEIAVPGVTRNFLLPTVRLLVVLIALQSWASTRLGSQMARYRTGHSSAELKLESWLILDLMTIQWKTGTSSSSSSGQSCQRWSRSTS
jgi:hypothetical protein